jgi:hypothetical protein
MRGTWGVVAVLLALTSVGCIAPKPKRNLRPPEVQCYDLPPMDPKYAEAPVYPEEKRTAVNPNKGVTNGAQNAMSSPGAPGGVIGGGGMPK